MRKNLRIPLVANLEDERIIELRNSGITIEFGDDIPCINLSWDNNLQEELLLKWVDEEWLSKKKDDYKERVKNIIKDLEPEKEKRRWNLGSIEFVLGIEDEISIVDLIGKLDYFALIYKSAKSYADYNEVYGSSLNLTVDEIDYWFYVFNNDLRIKGEIYDDVV